MYIPPRSIERIRLVAALSSLALAASCGGKQTVASKSAAAYQEARAKGLPVEGGGHGDHGMSGGGAMRGMEHSTTKRDSAEMDHSHVDKGEMAGMDHSKMQHGSAAMDHSMKRSGVAGMSHSQMQHGGMAGMDHSRAQHGSMAGMDHSKTQHGGMTGMDHSKTQEGMSMGDPATAAIVADKSAQPTPGEPAAHLSPDPVDAPAATAVEDAERSAQMNEAMSSGDGMMMMSHGMYVHRDAGRSEAAPQQPMHHDHQERPQKPRSER